MYGADDGAGNDKDGGEMFVRMKMAYLCKVLMVGMVVVVMIVVEVRYS